MLRRLRIEERGATALEFALVGGLLFMLLIGTLQVGRALMARNAISHAVSETVREVHLNRLTTVNAVLADLEARMDWTTIDVEVTRVAGTNYMQIDVTFPFLIEIPFIAAREVALRVETLAPIVSPLQQQG
jgi:Flp pilus assembly pilin Flp